MGFGPLSRSTGLEIFLVLTLTALFVGAVVTGAGVYQSVLDGRTATVTVTGDLATRLDARPHPTSAGTMAHLTLGSLGLTITDLSYNVKNVLTNVLTLTNTGDTPITLSVKKHDKVGIWDRLEGQPEIDRVTVFVDTNGNRQVDPGEALDGRVLAAGETVDVSILVDLNGFRADDDDDNGLTGPGDDFIDELEIRASSATE